MLIWLLAIAAGIAAAVLSYGVRPTGMRLGTAALRAVAVAAVVSLLLDAAAGTRRPADPLVALDVSQSWLRARDSAAFAAARQSATTVPADSLLLFGDSLRGSSGPLAPADQASRVRPAVEHALASGRPLIVVTDGEVDDPDALTMLPSGSRVDIPSGASARDAALSDLRAPRVVAVGDTLDIDVTVAAGGAGAGPGRLAVSLGERPPTVVAVDSLAPHAERSVRMRLVTTGNGPVLLRAVLQSTGDQEPRNDSLFVAIDVTPAAGAVLVSTNPDVDVRELMTVLRGTVSLPTRGFYRVAANVWREEGALTPASEDAVRAAARAAPLLVLHGDTAIFGDPRSTTRGSLLLFAPPAEATGEWYATGAPPSPLASALSGVAWDSLPPLDVSATVPVGEADILETRRARRLERRIAIVAWERPRRIAVVGASGFWRWRVRGGVGAVVHTALWGSMFDWLAAEHSDTRAVVPVEGAFRAGHPIRWRRGNATDTLAVVRLRKRGSDVTDSLRLRFTAGTAVTETPPLESGVYDVDVRGGRAILAVNASAELLPRRPTVTAGAVGSGPALGDAPRLRLFGWAFAIAILALCAEWLLRRKLGLR